MAKSIIDIYQLHLPDLILSIQTSDIDTKNQIHGQSDISIEIKYAIQHGVVTTAKIASRICLNEFHSTHIFVFPFIQMHGSRQMAPLMA